MAEEQKNRLAEALETGAAAGALWEGRKSVGKFLAAAAVLNSETAIIENANTITFTISGILGEGMEDVMERIERDFAASDGDGMEIVNPYETSPVYNANLFVSQCCAAKEKEFADISIADMAAVMRRGKSHLYSYRRTEEIREKTVEDPETGEETTVSEKWMIYTVLYNGEDYFADQVFALTENQKELATDYAGNLSLFPGDGLVQERLLLPTECKI